MADGTITYIFDLKSLRVIELQARLKALEFKVAGMQAENDNRARDGWAQAYSFNEFAYAEEDAEKIAREINAIAAEQQKRGEHGPAQS